MKRRNLEVGIVFCNLLGVDKTWPQIEDQLSSLIIAVVVSIICKHSSTALFLFSYQTFDKILALYHEKIE